MPGIGIIKYNLRFGMAEAKRKMTIKQQAKAVLAEAEKKGVQSNFFFATTFKRYQVQMKILEELEKAISEEGALVSKEYVKGRANIYTNPAITEYNKTVTAANNTVSTLINIVKSLPDDDDSTSKPKLAQLLDELNE